MNIFSLFFVSFLLSVVNAKTHTWYFQTTYVNANPDGCKEKQVVGFNNSWPLPVLRVKKGDRVQLYLNNGLPDRNTSLHFHGLFQHGTNQMDGPEMVTQCPIAPNDTMLYNFTVEDQAGTYWYHSHTKTQYGDGMRAAFIIEDEKYPFDFDEEVVLTVSENYHKTTFELMPLFLSRFNPTGAEPIPQNVLFNDSRNVTWNVEPNKTYFVRIINVGMFVSQYLFIEDHEFEVVEVDGVYVEKNTTQTLYITTAQRYGVLIKTKNSTDKNYAFMANMDATMLDVQPPALVTNSTNFMVYNKDKDLPKEYTVDDYNELDDFYLTTLNKTELYDDPDHTITIDVVMDNLDNGVNYAFFNETTYTPPKVPTLATVLSAGDMAANEQIYGSNTHTFVLNYGDTIDIVLNNKDTGKHPFHLHGHTFQLIERHAEVGEKEDPVLYDPSNHAPWPKHPMMRDTVFVEPHAYMVMRFKADNPGVWFFHCHIDWHLEQGLAIVLVEAPDHIQKDSRQALTDNYKQVCKNVGVPSDGNAAANSDDFLNLKGENVQEKNLPAGFTARGIVALVFSAIAAVLGLIAISIYGMAEISNVEERVARDLDIDLTDESSSAVENVREPSEGAVSLK